MYDRHVNETSNQDEKEVAAEPLKLEQAPILGKQKRTVTSRLNSVEQVKRTKRDIEWKGQSLLDVIRDSKGCMYDTEDVEEIKDTAVGEKQRSYNAMTDHLLHYYRGKCFPYQLVYKIFKHCFKEREFSLYIYEDNKDLWKRSISLV